MIKKAKWICCGPEPELPIVEKEFFCEGGKIKKAKIRINFIRILSVLTILTQI